ncbi:nucleotidyltransferase family protein [Nakamurella leprariae]|uniref:Nucleotidyltransferase family protein n=1 Tax=Nakamurella leprariae TaxID=2803911 RepID=A0A939BYB5_9ACTN|nr:nucleotidyltransferase family protein [Nakamurella leprariae]MBM9466436.1 nucleotidyltransferase family protein [Nakamurella leprariae]
MIAGLLLAAGSGRRYGRPKALVDSGHGPWVRTSLAAMAGCDRRCVVIGAAAEDVAALVPADVRTVVNAEHEAGMGTSLVTGLRGVLEDDHAGAVDAVLVMLVDLPDVGADVIDRVLADVRAQAAPRTSVVRAAYAGVPGHPVVFGRDHLAAVMASSGGDRGARDFLAGRDVTLIECSDLADGTDVDRPR